MSQCTGQDNNKIIIEEEEGGGGDIRTMNSNNRIAATLYSLGT